MHLRSNKKKMNGDDGGVDTIDRLKLLEHELTMIIDSLTMDKLKIIEHELKRRIFLLEK